MADKLVVVETSEGFRIKWKLDGDYDDLGATIGEGDYKDRPEPKLDDEDKRNAWLADTTAYSFDPEKDAEGYYWFSRKQAVAVLAAIKLAFKKNRPIPTWEKEALAHGWKPPKGFERR